MTILKNISRINLDISFDRAIKISHNGKTLTSKSTSIVRGKEISIEDDDVINHTMVKDMIKNKSISYSMVQQPEPIKVNPVRTQSKKDKDLPTKRDESSDTGPSI